MNINAAATNTAGLGTWAPTTDIVQGTSRSTTFTVTPTIAGSYSIVIELDNPLFSFLPNECSSTTE